MDGRQPPPISPRDLHDVIGTKAALFDVCRSAAFDAVDRMLAGTLRRAPDEIRQWVREVPTGRPVVVCHGAFYA